MDVQEGDTVRQFVTKTLDPLENLDNFKICLTRLWFNTDVLVEWKYASGNDRKFVIERFLYLCYSKRVLKTIEHLRLGSSVG